MNDIENDLDILSDKVEELEGLLHCVRDSLEKIPMTWHINHSLNVTLDRIGDIENYIDQIIIEIKDEKHGR